MLVVQLTDFHVVEEGARLAGVDTRAAFARVLAWAKSLSPRPDLVIASGDLAEHATGPVYGLIAEGLRSLGVPFLVVPGNHDERAPFRAGFSGEVGSDPEHLATARTVEGVRVIALDTLVDGAAHGELSARQLAWLRAELDAPGREPALIVMHHPPMPTGIPAMDAIGLRAGRAELETLLAGRPGIIGILCGHIHRAMAGRFAGHAVRVAPSAAFQFRLDFAQEGRFDVVEEPPQAMLHRIDVEAGELTSYLVPV
ncbi:phosphodiesterase [Xanthobacteraceae bacterium A53D]